MNEQVNKVAEELDIPADFLTGGEAVQTAEEVGVESEETRID